MSDFPRTDMRVFVTLFVIIAIDSMNVGLVWPLFGPLFMQHVGSILPDTMSLFMRDILYAITIGIFPVCLFFAAPVLGNLSDFMGRKRVLLICLFGTSIGLVICTLSIIWHSVYLLIFGRAVLGLLAGNIAIAQAIIIDITSQEKKASSLGIIAIATNFGFILGPIIGGVLINKNLVHWFSVTTPFVMAASLSFLNAIFLVVIFREKFHKKVKVIKYAELRTLLCFKFTNSINILATAFAAKSVKTLGIIYFCMQFGWSLYFQFNIISLIQYHHYSGILVSYFLASLYVVYALTSLFGIRILLRYFSIAKILPFTLVGMILALMGAGIDTELFLWLVMPIVSACTAINYNCLLTLLSNSVSKDVQGRTMGVASAINAVAWASGAFLSGLLGSFSRVMPFFLSGLAICIGLILFKTSFPCGLPREQKLWGVVKGEKAQPFPLNKHGDSFPVPRQNNQCAE